jgi:hypothetical protein
MNLSLHVCEVTLPKELRTYPLIVLLLIHLNLSSLHLLLYLVSYGILCHCGKFLDSFHEEFYIYSHPTLLLVHPNVNH